MTCQGWITWTNQLYHASNVLTNLMLTWTNHVISRVQAWWCGGDTRADMSCSDDMDKRDHAMCSTWLNEKLPCCQLLWTVVTRGLINRCHVALCVDMDRPRIPRCSDWRSRQRFFFGRFPRVWVACVVPSALFFDFEILSTSIFGCFGSAGGVRF